MYGTGLTLKRLISIVILRVRVEVAITVVNSMTLRKKKKSVLWALQSHAMTALEPQEPEHFHFLLILLITTCTSFMILCKPGCLSWKQKWKEKKTLSELQYLFPCKLWLNPSTIDGHGEGAWWNRRGLQASLEVTMTTLRAAPTGHRHTENLSGRRTDTYQKEHPERRKGWGQ